LARELTVFLWFPLQWIHW